MELSLMLFILCIVVEWIKNFHIRSYPDLDWILWFWFWPDADLDQIMDFVSKPDMNLQLTKLLYYLTTVAIDKF